MPEPPSEVVTPAMPAAPAEQGESTEGAADAAPSVFQRAATYRANGWSPAAAMRAARLDEENAL